MWRWNTSLTGTRHFSMLLKMGMEQTIMMAKYSPAKKFQKLCSILMGFCEKISSLYCSSAHQFWKVFQRHPLKLRDRVWPGISRLTSLAKALTVFQDVQRLLLMQKCRLHTFVNFRKNPVFTSLVNLELKESLEFRTVHYLWVSSKGHARALNDLKFFFFQSILSHHHDLVE